MVHGTPGDYDLLAMKREESFKRIFAPRDVTSVRQQSMMQEQSEWDPLDAAQQEFDDAGFPTILQDVSEARRRMRASADSILGRGDTTEPSSESSTTSPSSAESEAETLTDSHSADGTKEGA